MNSGHGTVDYILNNGDTHYFPKFINLDINSKIFNNTEPKSNKILVKMNILRRLFGGQRIV
jgi:hypothetical protein